jgi:hypothetical protein
LLSSGNPARRGPTCRAVQWRPGAPARRDQGPSEQRRRRHRQLDRVGRPHGLSGIISNTVATIQAAINAARAAAHHGKGRWRWPGAILHGLPSHVIQGNFGDKGDYGNALLDNMVGDQKRAEIAGGALLNGIVRGLKKGERTLKNVMAGLKDYIQTKTDKLNEILTDQSSFVQSFRDAFSESIFSAQFTDAEGNNTAPTLASMRQFAEQQQANAHALAATSSRCCRGGCRGT